MSLPENTLEKASVTNGIDASNDSTPNARLESPGIVSVNARGATGDDLAKKLLFLTVAAGILIVAGVYGFNKWRGQQKLKDSEAVQQSKVENKPAQVGPKREFTQTPPVSTPVTIPNPTGPQVASNPTGANAPCKDVVVLDGTGKPLLGSTGQPIRVACDGKMVPAIDPKAAPAIQTPNQPGTNNASTLPPPSRFGGDVMIQNPLDLPAGAPRPPTGPQTPQNTVDLIKQLMGGTQGKPANAPGDVSGAAGRSGGFFPSAQAQTLPQAPNQGTGGSSGGTASQQGAIGNLMTVTPTPKVQAANLGDRNMLISKGTQIDCAMTVKLVNEVSGFSSCVLTNNVYSDNGKVLLLERGSDLQGEYGATIQQGQRRIFVLWDRVKTPKGIVIALASPAADGLGTMGLDGHVDNRWWDRLGAAFLLSFIKDAIAFEIAKSSSGSAAGGVVYQNTARTGEQMADRVLASTINIKPTIYKNQGDRASVYVARDLDFSNVYALRAR